MNKKRIHTILIFDGDKEIETWGQYNNVKKDALDILSKFEPDKIVGFLWYWQDYERREDRSVYTGCNNITNVSSHCAPDNKITAERAINIIKTTGIDGSSFYHVPDTKVIEEVHVSEELIDE